MAISLKKTKEQLLDSAKQIGLIGELRFLGEFMFILFCITTAVEAWRAHMEMNRISQSMAIF